MTNIDSILKTRHSTKHILSIVSLTKVLTAKAMVFFPVAMYGCESWTVKKAERQRIDAFKLVLEKTPESSLDCKEIQPVHSKGNPS